MRYIVVIILLVCLVTIISSSPIKISRNSEESFELKLESVEIPDKIATKRDAPEIIYEPPRPRRQYMSTRAHFYNLLMDILKTMQTSAKDDIRYAKERDLQRRSIQMIEN